MGILDKFKREKAQLAPSAPARPKWMPYEEKVAMARRAKEQLGDLTADDIFRSFGCTYGEALRIRDEIYGYRDCDFKVAGVTFKNDDGSSRQKWLRLFMFRNPPFEGNSLTLTVEPYEFEGQPAYYVKVDGYTMGTIEAKAVPEMQRISDHIINLYLNVDRFMDKEKNKHVYYANLHVRYCEDNGGTA